MRFTTTILCMGALSLNAADNSGRPAKPNVILMLTDDLGWQDVKCYDIDEESPYETPNIDRLAKLGVMFRQGYSPAPTCAPSRCAIISGIHPARSQKTHVVGGAPPAPHNKKNTAVMEPWYSGRLGVDKISIAKALKTNGYTTGHTGKWHIAIDHHAYPQPKDHGFDITTAERGVTNTAKPNRLSGFATTSTDDPYRLDENGIPRDPNTENAIDFIEQAKDKPFFLYFATWLVHTPIHTRSKVLLEKYCKKLGIDFPTDPGYVTTPGQTNPYYCAMVEMLDGYVGQLITYLETTDDPRWPGHKLMENAYFIFTSDNGGMERHGKEIITDNYPLDKGKINAKEGGTRVPFIIAGPGIKAGVDSEVMVNGLDFYPTILKWTKTKKPQNVTLDGCDISTLLSKDATNASLVKNDDGLVRDTMQWHFPHGAGLQTTIRTGNYKLIYNYAHVAKSKHNPKPELELYKLYDANNKRVDIEEAKNIVDQMPERAQRMKTEMFKGLAEMKATPAYLNPHYRFDLPNKDKVCTVLDAGKSGNTVFVKFKENGAKIVKGYLMYTLNGGERYEEWFRNEGDLQSGVMKAALPRETSHYVFNLIDENGFLVSYPEMEDTTSRKKSKSKFSVKALKVN